MSIHPPARSVFKLEIFDVYIVVAVGKIIRG